VSDSLKEPTGLDYGNVSDSLKEQCGTNHEEECDSLKEQCGTNHERESDSLKEQCGMNHEKGSDSLKEQERPYSQCNSAIISNALKPKFNFQFFCQEIGQFIPVLLDTGAMLNIVSSDLVKSHGLSPTGRTKVKLKFGGGNEILVTQSIILTLTQDKYERKIEFLVAAIHIPMILGTPWFSSVSISNLTWEEKRLTFVDLETKTEYSLNSHPPQVIDISYVEFVTNLENQEFEEWGLIDVYSVSERNQERIPIVGGSETQKELDMLIEEYEDIFRKPKEPPLQLNIDNR
jgi:hypothetical protein